MCHHPFGAHLQKNISIKPYRLFLSSFDPISESLSLSPCGSKHYMWRNLLTFHMSPCWPAFIGFWCELRTKLLVVGNAITKCGGSPIGYQGFGCSGHQHQSRSMQFTLWDDLICYMIEQAKMREFLLTANANNYKIFECPLVHLGYTSYRHLSCGWNYKIWTKRRIVLSLAHNKDSKPWTLSCGESLLSFPGLVCI